MAYQPAVNWRNAFVVGSIFVATVSSAYFTHMLGTEFCAGFFAGVMLMGVVHFGERAACRNSPLNNGTLQHVDVLDFRPLPPDNPHLRKLSVAELFRLEAEEARKARQG